MMEAQFQWSAYLFKNSILLRLAFLDWQTTACTPTHTPTPTHPSRCTWASRPVRGPSAWLRCSGSSSHSSVRPPSLSVCQYCHCSVWLVTADGERELTSAVTDSTCPTTHRLGWGRERLSYRGKNVSRYSVQISDRILDLLFFGASFSWKEK